MGMRGLGHIKYLCDIARPSIAVVTNVGHAHIGEVGSQENIALAKSEIVRDLNASDTAILNADDPFVYAMREITQAHVLTYGLSDDADVQALNVEQRANGTCEFDVLVAGETLHIALPLIGQHNVYNALAAIAVARVVGMSTADVVQALSEVTTVSAWRMQVKQLDSGITLINDAYNANPESMAAALRTLAGLAKRGHSWAVLGLMGELGSHSQEQHDALGRLAVRLDISHLVVVGQNAKLIYMGASQEGSWDGESVWFPDFSTASEYIVEKVSSEDVVLFKASRSAHFEELCDLVEKNLTASQEGAAK
jgi:UDP-N-acetylmuramoyl-tripeptide--D-alanyl-D-alanine ligase